MKYLKKFEKSFNEGDYVKVSGEIYKIIDKDYREDLGQIGYFIQPLDDLEDQEDTTEGYWETTEFIHSLSIIELEKLKLELAIKKYNL